MDKTERWQKEKRTTNEKQNVNIQLNSNEEIRNARSFYFCVCISLIKYRIGICKQANITRFFFFFIFIFLFY